MKNVKNRRAEIVLAGLLSLCLLAGCKDESPEADVGPRVENITSGPVKLTITAGPGTVRLDRDVMLSVRATCPSDVLVRIPDIGDRLTGFVLKGELGTEPVESQGTTISERRFRLSPLVSDEYRLGPMAIVYRNRHDPSSEKWFATRPIVFEFIAPVEGEAADDISVEMSPVWIRPSFQVISLYSLLVLAVIAALILVMRLVAGIRHEQKLRKMSARDRALMELAQLMRKDLVGKSKVKEFYVELTLVVRRYVERRHLIRAPEQTTEEFLEAVSNDSRFGPDIVTKLEAFLEAADLVKFAAFKPGPDAIGHATDTARDYIQSESPDIKNDAEEATDEED